MIVNFRAACLALLNAKILFFMNDTLKMKLIISINSLVAVRFVKNHNKNPETRKLFVEKMHRQMGENRL